MSGMVEKHPLMRLSHVNKLPQQSVVMHLYAARPRIAYFLPASTVAVTGSDVNCRISIEIHQTFHMLEMYICKVITRTLMPLLVCFMLTNVILLDV